MSSLASQQLPDGFVPAESLVGQHNQDEIRTYGEYVTWFVYNHYTHWLYTGDRGYLNKWWPQLTKAMAWLESVRAQDPQGLISFADVKSCGHYGYSDCGHETYVNALYKRNLDDMATLAKARGDVSDAGAYAARATEVEERDQLPALGRHDGRLPALAGDPERLPAGRQCHRRPHRYRESRPVRAGDGLPAREQLEHLRSLTVSPSTPNASIKPFYEPLPSGFEASARLAVADPDGAQQRQALQLMRTFWGYQLSQDPGGTFWEKADLNGQPGIQQFTSLAHGWAAGPTVSLTTQVLGVEPTSGGFSTYSIVPTPGGLSWAQGSVPTPHGDITASWRSSSHGFTLNASAPRGTVGELAVPTDGHKVSVKLDGRTVWNGTRGVGGAHVTRDGVNIYVQLVSPGHHTLSSHNL